MLVINKNVLGDFMSVAKTVQNQAAEFPNISVIYGFDLVPQDEALFADLSLHPNDKGQNLLARAILTSLKTHYVPFGNGFNPMS